MNDSFRPKLRPMDSFPMRQPDGDVEFVLRDPEGFSSPVMLPYAAAMVASLMDGQRTLPEIQAEYQQRFGEPLGSADLHGVIEQLDARSILDNEKFRAVWKQELTGYLNNPYRPAALAGRAYPAEPAALRNFLDGMFTQPKGPGLPNFDRVDRSSTDQLVGVLCPHVDLQRAALALAHSYKRVVEDSEAELFVILGSPHRPMRHLYSATRKSFSTPLGLVKTDEEFISLLDSKLQSTGVGDELQLFNDELAHRQEHSIEFQVLLLQHLLGERRSISIVPILVSSFQEIIAAGEQPSESKPVRAFIQALRRATEQSGRKVCFICSGDLAHIGQRHGDKWLLDEERLRRQAESDRRLLEIAAARDAQGVVDHVAARGNQDRICGLGPIYTLLSAMQAERGELLRHDQAVELDFTACVSFGSIAFYA